MSNKHNKRKQPIIRLFVPIIKILAVFTVLGLITWAVLKSNLTEFLKVDIYWNIEQTLPLTQNALMDKIKPLIEDKYQLDLVQIKQSLESEPWINNAHIKRLFWNAIQININPHQIAMRWQNTNCKNQQLTDCKGYISTEGLLFIPKKLIPSAAVLAISTQDSDTINKLHKNYQHYQMLAKPMLIKSFSKTNIEQLTFKSGVKVILGYQQQSERLRKFIKAYNKLKHKNAKIKSATFDMRYPKGFALSY